MVRNQKGVALVLTVMAVSFMVAVTVYLFSTVNWQLQASVNLRDSVILDAANRSGLSLARAALVTDQKENKSDSLHDIWYSLEKEKLAQLLKIETFAISVTDLSGLLQVNALVPVQQAGGQPPGGKPGQQQQQQQQQQEQLWLRFLTSGQFGDIEQSEARALIQAMKDWIDDDGDLDLVRDPGGAEREYYLSLSPPYEPRNGPLQSVEELLLIKGMTPELFYGNEEHPGIGSFITAIPVTDGRVNINTAPPEILLALAENMDEEMVRRVVEFRENVDNQAVLENTDWYRNNNVLPGFIVIPPEILTVSSNYFRIRSDARFGAVSRSGTGILERLAGGAQNLLSWEVR